MVVVAGLGITGQSVLRFYQAQGDAVLAYDTRADFDVSALQKSFPEMQFAVGDFPKSWAKKVQKLVLSPGIDMREAWVQKLISTGVEVVGDIELFARAVGVPVIAITGSNGKSTVTTLVGEVLSRAGYKTIIAGNIGLPALDALLDENEYDVYVLELSSFQLETTESLHSISATILNVSEDHMDRYDDFASYVQAKAKIFSDTELVVLPQDFIEVRLATNIVSRFGLAAPEDKADYGLLKVDGEIYLAHGQTPLINTADMLLKGQHHQLNALAMMALCEPFQISKQVYSQVLTNFAGLPHRTQLVTEVNGVQWINDSKGTNVGATLTALQTFGSQISGEVVLLAGGVGKDADFSPLAESAKQFCRTVILFGRDRDLIQQALNQSGFEAIQLTETLSEAVSLAATLVQSGDCVMFSPACASFDQFKNYVDRGEQFKQIVEQQFAD